MDSENRRGAWPTREPLGAEPSGARLRGRTRWRGLKAKCQTQNPIEEMAQATEQKWLPRVTAQEWLASEDDRTEGPLAAKGETQGQTRTRVVGTEAWGGSDTWPRGRGVGERQPRDRATRAGGGGLPQRMGFRRTGAGVAWSVGGTAGTVENRLLIIPFGRSAHPGGSAQEKALILCAVFLD